MTFKAPGRLNSLPPWEIFLLMLVWILASQLAPAMVDSVRDIYEAYTIASGSSFPLEGPKLANTFHLGPLWFYILAIPAGLFGSVSGIVFVVSLLSALKFWLAFSLGRQLHSAQLGLSFALFLALPSWSSTQFLTWTHTSVLETSVILYLLSLHYSYMQPSTGRWLLTGLCFSLALHAHPTTAPFIFLLPLALKSPEFQWRWVGWVILGIVIPFLPYGVNQLVNGFPDLSALQGYQSKEFSPGGPLTMLRLLYSVVVTGPNLYYKTALSANLAVYATTLHWTLMLVLSLFGLLRFRTADSDLKKLITLAIGMLILIIVSIVVIRSRTPWYWAYTPSLILSFFYAVVASIAIKSSSWPKVRPLLSAIILTLFLAAIIGIGHRVYNNTIRSQKDVLFDVKSLEGPWSRTGFEIPAFQSDEHGRFLCQQGSTVLHGPYAAIIDEHAGLEAQLSCGQKRNILIGGVPRETGYRHITGVTTEMSEILGVQAEERIGNVHFYSPLAVSTAGTSIALPEWDETPLRKSFFGGESDIGTLTLSSAKPSALLITKPVGYFMTLDVNKVTCNDQPAELMTRTNYSWLFQCGGTQQEGPMQWKAWYVVSADNLIDAVLLPTSSK